MTRTSSWTPFGPLDFVHRAQAVCPTQIKSKHIGEFKPHQEILKSGSLKLLEKSS